MQPRSCRPPLLQAAPTKHSLVTPRLFCAVFHPPGFTTRARIGTEVDPGDMASTEKDKNFLIILEAMETLVAAKKDLPAIHVSHDHLSRMIDDLANQMYHDWLHNGDRVLLPCQVMSRMLKLHVSVKEIPQSLRVWSTIADNKRIGSTYTSPGCKDAVIHRHLLSIFGSLESENIDNQVVQKAVLEAFDYHSAITANQEEREATPAADQERSTAPAKDEESGLSEIDRVPPRQARKPTAKRPWSIPVASARFPDKHLWGSCMALDYDPQAGTLVAQEVDKPKVKAGSKVSVDVSCLTHLRHDASKLCIRLVFLAEGKYIVDLRMHTKHDGEDLVRKITAIIPEGLQVGLV
ncbi:MAG: hypothetical protein Q9185_004624 [Variospora sp. 1 TL-2023]